MAEAVVEERLLTDDEKQQVQRLLFHHYTQGVIDAVNAVATAVTEFGVSAEVVTSTLNELVDTLEDEHNKMEKETTQSE